MYERIIFSFLVIIIFFSIVQHSLVTLVELTTIWWANYWNLLGFRM